MPAGATRVFLMRHGEVDHAWHGRIYGALDVPLSAQGREEAARAASFLAEEPLALVISSGLARAEFGATCLRAPRRLARQDDADLRELERGSWAGKSLVELEREQPGAWTRWHGSPGSSRPPAGESLDDLAARVLPRIDFWAAARPGGSIAIVTHGWVIRVVLCATLGMPNALATRFDVRTGDVLAFDWPARSLGPPPELIGFALDSSPSGDRADRSG